MTRIRIENVVASTSLASALDLEAIGLKLPGAEYDPHAFPGLIYRLEEPKTAMLLFGSGKAVCTGGKSWNQANAAVQKVAEVIRRRGHTIVPRPKIRIQNIVATSNLEAELNLNSVAVTLGLDRIEYEPEQFPGLVCRLKEPRVVILLFGSGKLVCTGARRPAEIGLAVRAITSELQAADLIPRERPRSKFTVKRAAPRVAPHPEDDGSLSLGAGPGLPHVPSTIREAPPVASE